MKLDVSFISFFWTLSPNKFHSHVFIMKRNVRVTNLFLLKPLEETHLFAAGYRALSFKPAIL